MALSADPCSLASSILAAEQAILSTINSKFDAIQRLVQLIYEAGEAMAHMVPDPAQFIPVNLIDISLYDQLVSACPMLGLPAIGELDDQQLGTLRAEVENAYQSLFAPLFQTNPWGMIAHYQAIVNDSINSAFDKLGRDWLVCANVTCNTPSSVNLSELKDLRDKFTQICNGDLTLLNPTQSTAYGDFLAKKDAIGELFMSQTTKDAWTGLFPK